MKNEEYYNKIKGFLYKKFDALEVKDTGTVLDLRNKKTRSLEISIFKKSGGVYYAYEFSDKFCKYFSLKKIDFQIILKMWVENKFKIKVNGMLRLQRE